MDSQQFAQAVAGLRLNQTAFFDSIGSTNDVVAEWAAAGHTGPALAAAGQQTQGRGRDGRRWHTPPGSALAASLLLPLPAGFDPGALGRLSGLGGLAVCEALEALGLQPQIKWPNDVLLNGKKVCGVLAEAHWAGERLQAVLLGIGINLAASAVPPAAELNFPATCVEVEVGRPVAAAALLRSLLQHLLAWLPRLADEALLLAWEARLAYKGQRVQLHSGPARWDAQLLGLAPDGRLRLRLEDGEERSFQAGEIRIRPGV